MEHKEEGESEEIWLKAKKNQGLSEVKLGKEKEGLPEPSEGAWPHPYFHFGLLASEYERTDVCCLSYQFIAICYSILSKHRSTKYKDFYKNVLFNYIFNSPKLEVTQISTNR